MRLYAALSVNNGIPLANSIDGYHFGLLKNEKAIVQTKRRILLNSGTSFLDYYREGDNGKYPWTWERPGWE